MAAYLVIFGAAVRPDGSASGSLARRVNIALTIAERLPNCRFIATGGVGRYGDAEARVVSALLIQAGVAAPHIIIEDRARDTLESAILCHALLSQRNDVELVIPCSSSYHNPRCALLLRLLGYPVRLVRVASDRPHLGWRQWMLYVLKECLVLPYDAVLVLLRGKT